MKGDIPRLSLSVPVRFESMFDSSMLFRLERVHSRTLLALVKAIRAKCSQLLLLLNPESWPTSKLFTPINIGARKVGDEYCKHVNELRTITGNKPADGRTQEAKRDD